MRIGAGDKVGTADAFVIVSVVIKTFLVWRLQIRASAALSVAVFFTGPRRIFFTGGIFAVTRRTNTVIRLMTFFEVVVANANLKVRRIDRTKVLAVGKRGTGGQFISCLFTGL